MSDWKNVQYKDGKMRTSEGGGGSSTFAGLDDVSFSDIQNGQIPKYNSTTQKWENANESGGGASALADLTDVNLTNIQDGQIIKWDDTTQKFVNADESGGSSGFTQTVIYTGSGQPTYYELTQPLTDFDAIAVYTISSSWYTSNIFLVSELMDKAGVDARFGTFSDAAYIYFKVIDASTLQRSDTNGWTIYKIVGLKFSSGGGGGGGSSDLPLSVVNGELCITFEEEI